MQGKIDYERIALECGLKVIVKTQTDGNGISISTPGVFEKKGEIFIVKPNKEKTRLYCMKLVETVSDRITETGKRVTFDFEYAKGAIYDLTEDDRMDIERAKELMIRYGRCIVCGRKLKVAESVERGIGPICIKYFRRTEESRRKRIEAINERANRRIAGHWNRVRKGCEGY